MPKQKPETTVRKSMESLGTYKKEFDPIISVYVQLWEQYEILTQRYIDGGYRFECEGNTGTKKAPIVTTLEALRRDLLNYASQLGLTPMGLLKADDKAFAKKKQKKGILSVLEEAGA